MPDRVERLRQAAQARHAATVDRAEEVLRAAVRRGEPISMKRFSELAGVSRSWLYRQPEVRAQLERLRQLPPRPAGHHRDAQRASLDSLRQQLQTCRQEIARLRAENNDIKSQLARRLGEDRAAAVTKQSS